MMSKTGISWVFVVLGSTALGCLTGGCTENHPCDEGQVLEANGYCIAAPADAAIPVPESDASVAEAAGSEASGASTAYDPAFDRTCTTSADCVAPADYCANPPGKCTAKGCDVDPSICPSAWPCLDLTPFGMAMHICVPPGT
jgi:hypothetical protein